MEPTETDQILRLAEAIANGRSLTWDEPCAEAEAGEGLLEQLRVLARLSDVDRSGEFDGPLESSTQAL